MYQIFVSYIPLTEYSLGMPYFFRKMKPGELLENEGLDFPMLI